MRRGEENQRQGGGKKSKATQEYTPLNISNSFLNAAGSRRDQEMPKQNEGNVAEVIHSIETQQISAA